MQNITFLELWHWKIFSIDGKEILVSNIAFASLFLILSIILYRKVILKAFDFVIQKSFKHNAQELYLLRQLMNYVFLLICLCFILSIANIPFTIFAFLGGAIAISVGLGAQNFIGDFINGFLVIMGKSVNVGDIIKIDNIIGKIEQIGIRHTRIKTSENTDLIIPNNAMISSKLIKYRSKKPYLKSKIYLKINNKNFKTNDIEQKILQALDKIPELSGTLKAELYLIEISDKTYKYQLNYYPQDFEKYNREYIQNLVNHSLVQLLPDIEIKLPK